MESKGLLTGVKVLDLSRVLAGPYCGMMLADMGADVLKIELPGKGDDARHNAPMVGSESAYFMNLNRNKRGITLNLKSGEGKKIFRKLVERSDIVIENYRPGVMEKLGLGYEDLKKINPGIVYGCVSGFGHFGPYSKRAGYDIIGQVMSGLMSTTGWPDSPPTRTGTAIAGSSRACGYGIDGKTILPAPAMRFFCMSQSKRRCRTRLRPRSQPERGISSSTFGREQPAAFIFFPVTEPA